MARLIESPTRIIAAGNKPKATEEFIGRINVAVCVPAFSPETVHRDGI